MRRSYLRNSVNSSGSHFYDSVQSTSRPNTGLSCSIYSMPEADYSLIMEQRQTKVSYQALKVRLGTAYHLHSQKRHRLEASCGFYRPDAICQKVVSIKPVDFIRLAATWYLHTCCKLMKQLASSLHAVHNFQQVCKQLITDLLSSSRSKRCERILISAWW